MEEPDFQVALLLQRQLEHEASHDKDFNLAQRLQDDFNKEILTENPVGLIYDTKKKSENDSRSLVDPSWELVDPTPNIHNLFVAFNQRYFWDKLVAVCVSWAKTMTSCAGICYYQGRAGMCSIRLSEPLLKLRPRKDLVETLLHEMIHAYLFVTHNNRDRDGHGPEFHKHMYRINKEAGTNITVYHNFHDEVRLYQQHWWRCNGPCQTQHPYFGMVRRAVNRAPGPNDRWWGEHSRTCGGTFIKVKEPEKKSTNRKGSTPLQKAAPSNDIRNFVSVTKKNISNDGIHGIHNSDINHISPKISQVSGMGNIHGFTNLHTSGNSVVKQISNGNLIKKKNNVNSSTKTKSNSSSTLVIDNKKSKTETEQKTKSEVSMFYGAGKVLTPPSDGVDTKCSKNDYSVVRNHWLSKFSSTSSQSNKRNNNESDTDSTKKKKVQTEEAHADTVIDITNDSFVICPVCEKQVKELTLNAHLDECLLKQNNKSIEKKVCFICNKQVTEDEYRQHVNMCFDNNSDQEDDLTECEICNAMISKNKIDAHRKLCIENIFVASSPVEDFSNPCSTSTNAISGNLTQCSICDSFVDSEGLNSHQGKCILNMFDDLKEKHSLRNDDEVFCLVCNKKINKSELSAHLDECMSGVFDEKNPSRAVNTKKQNKDNCDNAGDASHKYNCPFCMELYSELDMSAHLDECLIGEDDNKSILVDSFSSDDKL